MSTPQQTKLIGATIKITLGSVLKMCCHYKSSLETLYFLRFNKFRLYIEMKLQRN